MFIHLLTSPLQVSVDYTTDEPLCFLVCDGYHFCSLVPLWALSFFAQQGYCQLWLCNRSSNIQSHNNQGGCVCVCVGAGVCVSEMMSVLSGYYGVHISQSVMKFNIQAVARVDFYRLLLFINIESESMQPL